MIETAMRHDLFKPFCITTEQSFGANIQIINEALWVQNFYYCQYTQEQNISCEGLGYCPQNTALSLFNNLKYTLGHSSDHSKSVVLHSIIPSSSKCLLSCHAENQLMLHILGQVKRPRSNTKDQQSLGDIMTRCQEKKTQVTSQF